MTFPVLESQSKSSAFNTESTVICYLLSAICYLLKMKNFNQNSLCDVCGVKKMEFKNAKMFKQHFDQHVHLKLPCNLCIKTFSTKLKLREHLRFTYQSQQECDICEKKFSNQKNLNSHKSKFLFCYPTTAISVNSNSIISTTL